MQLHFVGKNFEITDVLKQYITEKLEPLSKRHNHITNVNVVLYVEHIVNYAEASLIIDGLELHAKADSDDMYRAIDAMVSKLTTQINKHKEKIIDSHREAQ